MRIGYLTYGLDRAPTGIGRYAVQLLDALAALPEAPEIVLLTTEREDHHGLWARFARRPLGCRLLPELITRGNLALSAAAAELKLDLIHDPNGVAPFLGPAAGARRVVTIHDAVPFRFPERHNHLDNWRFRLMLPAAARRADAVLTDSASSAADLRQFLSLPQSKVRPVLLGADPRFAPAPPRVVAATLERYGIRSPYLLYVGGVNGRKNLEGLVSAFAAARAAHLDLSLVIGGARQWRSEGLERRVRRLGVAEQIHFTGYLPDDDLPALYSGAAAFVFPSLYEGFGLPVLEAMACGAPVITSSVSSLPEVAGDAALLVDPQNSAAIAIAIRRVLEERGLAASLSARGLARAARFTWATAARETFAIYDQLLGDRADLVAAGRQREATP